jgi:hypothetical protein
VKPATVKAISSAQATSTGQADVKTLSPVGGASCALISVETSDARMVFTTGETPSVTLGQIIKAGTSPGLYPVGAGSVVKFVSTVGGNAIVNVSWFR